MDEIFPKNDEEEMFVIVGFSVFAFSTFINLPDLVPKNTLEDVVVNGDTFMAEIDVINGSVMLLSKGDVVMFV